MLSLPTKRTHIPLKQLQKNPKKQHKNAFLYSVFILLLSISCTTNVNGFMIISSSPVSLTPSLSVTTKNIATTRKQRSADRRTITASSLKMSISYSSSSSWSSSPSPSSSSSWKKSYNNKNSRGNNKNDDNAIEIIHGNKKTPAYSPTRKNYPQQKDTSLGRTPTRRRQGGQVTVRQRRPNNNQQRKKRRGGRRTPQEEEERLRRAQDVEDRMVRALNDMRAILSSSSSSTDATTTHQRQQQTPLLLFPSVRECNAALATLGDHGDLLRALRLFVKMRKAASIASFASPSSKKEGTIKPFFHPPAPTLVTYSTLMSRAVQLGKARVALRLWKLMESQREFYTNYYSATNGGSSKKHSYMQPISQAPIVPDVKSVNILMNAYAKLGDYESAYSLLQQMLDTTTRRTEEDETSKKEKDHVPTLKPNLVTYNTLLDACHRANNLSKALDVLEEMKVRGIHPDARTYTTIISTVGRQRVIKNHESATFSPSPSPLSSDGATSHNSGSSSSSGRRGRRGDPEIAFELLYEMEQDYDIKPNGMTYCALIDVCGRCYRSDLALKGLRMMLLEKKKLMDMEKQQQQVQQNHWQQRKRSPLNTLFIHEVGAWTAAIDACCKSNRYDTAIKLFWTMQSSNFQNIKPNTVTCGCLIDRLLKAERISETLDVLRYMKEEGLEPSEVMYTSLMSCAERLARLERKNYVEEEDEVEEEEGTNIDVDYDGDGMGELDNRDKDFDFSIGAEGGGDTDGDGGVRSSGTKAIEVYTELMRSLMGSSSIKKGKTAHQNKHTISATRGDIVNNSSGNDAKTLLVKVFLVFQEMRDAGAEPDTACYNVLLGACARAGDFTRARNVLNKLIASDDLEPSHVSWREMLRAASRCTIRWGGSNSHLVEQIWEEALSYRGSSGSSDRGSASAGVGRSSSSKDDNDKDYVPWKPDVDAFEVLAESYMKEASSPSKSNEKVVGQSRRWALYEKVLEMYQDVMEGREDEQRGMAYVDKFELQESPRVMLIVLKAAVSLEHMAAEEILEEELEKEWDMEDDITFIVEENGDGNNAFMGHDILEDRLNRAQSVAKEIVQLECFQEGERLPNGVLNDSEAMNALKVATSWI